jgi:hypothetical protein
MVYEENNPEKDKFDETVKLIEKSTEDKFRQDEENPETFIFGTNQLTFEHILKNILENFGIYLQSCYDKLFADSMLTGLQEETSESVDQVETNVKKH